MPKGHFESARASIDYGNAAGLFPVDKLDATVLQYRDAQLALNDVDGTDVIIIAPTSLATSYHLTQHALTAIPVESLPPTVRAQLDEGIEESLDAFELIQIGKWNTNSSNHSYGRAIVFTGITDRDSSRYSVHQPWRVLVGSAVSASQDQGSDDA